MTLPIALKPSLHRLLRAAGLARLAARHVHVCYAIATGGNRLYADLVTISALSVRRIYPGCKITVLTDDKSLPNISNELQQLADAGAQIRSLGKFDGNARYRSRFVKTQVRNALDGDLLYLDADTAVVREFDDLFDCTAPFSAAIDRNRAHPAGGFPDWVTADFDRLGWRHPTRLYLNAGVIFWRDCAAARALGKLWHENWLRYSATVNNPADQPAFNHSIASLGLEPKILLDEFNARVGVSPDFAKGARIYHLLSGDERANGTFIDRLLTDYRESGQVDFRLVDAAAREGHPWITV